MFIHGIMLRNSYKIIILSILLTAVSAAQEGYINGTIYVNVTGAPTATFTVQVVANEINSSNYSIAYSNSTSGNYSLNLSAGNFNVTASKQPEYYDNTISNISVTASNTTIQDFLLSLKPTGNITGCVSVAGAPGRCGLPSISEDIFSAVEGFINFVAAFLASLVSGLIGLIYLFASVFAVVIFLIMFGLVFWVALWVLKK